MSKIVTSLPLDSSGRPLCGGVSKVDGVSVVPFQMDPDTGALLVATDSVAPTSVAATILNGQSAITTAALGIVGEISLLSIDAPSINGSGATYTISLVDADGKAFYTSGNNAENATSLIAITRRLVATDKITITSSVQVGANKAFAVRIR